MKTTVPFFTQMGFLVLCAACLSLVLAGKPRVTPSSHVDLPDDDDDFGIGRELTSLQKELRMGKQRFQRLWRTLREQHSDVGMAAYNQSIQGFRDDTCKLRASLSRHLRSLNGFMTCLTSCTRAHLTGEHENMEARIRYFCNKSCLMAMEQHQVVQTDPSRQYTSTPHPDTDPIVG